MNYSIESIESIYEIPAYHGWEDLTEYVCTGCGERWDVERWGDAVIAATEHDEFECEHVERGIRAFDLHGIGVHDLCHPNACSHA